MSKSLEADGWSSGQAEPLSLASVNKGDNLIPEPRRPKAAHKHRKDGHFSKMLELAQTALRNHSSKHLPPLLGPSLSLTHSKASRGNL